MNTDKITLTASIPFALYDQIHTLASMNHMTLTKLTEEALRCYYDAWDRRQHWLQAYYPERLVRLSEAEEAIPALEHQGSTGGQEYEEACKELCVRFEEARRLKFRAGGKIGWE